MRIPRQLSGHEVVHALRVLGYECVRREGSPVRLTPKVNGTHHRLIVEELLAKLGL